MRPQNGKRKPRLFLDSSILFSATLSETGGSFRLLKESHEQSLQIISNQYVIEEVLVALGRKYPETAEKFLFLENWARLEVVSNPPLRLVRKYYKVINRKDAPIVAGAIFANCHFLITLDKKHFLSEPLRNSTATQLTILTPAEFFQSYF